jgi:SAM-dependent methyltransferase
MYEYDDEFYRYINQGATDSARAVIPVLLDTLPARITSVLDVGCGAGAWLREWKSFDALVLGLDGDYVRRDRLLIDGDEFATADLAEGFAMDRTFDLVQSLEVAEHLPPESAAGFVASLCRHGDMVLFSAAPPGQGGENHLNEQPYEYWRELFQRQGFDMYDPVRNAVLGRPEIKPWYRYNMFLYVNTRAVPELRAALAAFRVPDGEKVADVSPALYRLRKHLVRLLPVKAGTSLAILKKNLFGLSLRSRKSGA